MFLFIMLFFLPKIMQKACQNSYSTGCQQVVDRPYKSYGFDYQAIPHK